jgi:hypothetical protein
MKIEEFITSATMDATLSIPVYAESIRMLPSEHPTARCLYGVKAPRGTIGQLISARDSGKPLHALMVGKTMSGRIIAGPCRMAPGEGLEWNTPVSEYCSREHAPKLIVDDTWCVVGIEKKARDSTWLNGEEFAGLQFIELEV